MDVARSSFYAAFGSKHAVMLEALELYTGELLARMRDAAKAEADPKRAVLAVLEIAACSDKPESGCLFVNLATELVPEDVQVRKLARAHLGKVDRLVNSLLARTGLSAREAQARSGAMIALAAGAVTLRKVGEPQARIRTMLGVLPSLMA